ncbi:MAG: hypothetical protein JRC92_11240 [Deltaproteobacteria bacterium]|nr:hypothetical protein [Deltaproteobacteria bacterium]
MAPFRLIWPLFWAMIVLMAGPVWGAALEPEDPFASRSPAASLKIIYRLTGRMEGQAILWVDGPRRVMVTQVKDNAFGLARPVHLREITTPERVVRLDLTGQRASIRANLRGLLSRRFEVLGSRQKRLVVRQMESLGQALGSHIGVGKVTVSEADFLGLGARRVKIGSDSFFFWSASDIPLHEVRRLDGLYWTREARDIILEAEVPEELFRLPDWVAEDDWAEELARAELVTLWIMDLLAQPFVYLPFQADEDKASKPGQTEVLAWRLLFPPGLRTEEAGGASDLAATPALVQPPLRPIPWPALAPPGFRTEVARFRVSPDWEPFPLPPGRRPWPPAGLIQDVLNRQAAALAWIINNFMPE